jgi:hypothetical protein
MKWLLVACLLMTGCNLLQKAGFAIDNLNNGNNVPLGHIDNNQVLAQNPQQPVAVQNPAPNNQSGTPLQRALLSRGFNPKDFQFESDPANQEVSALQIIARDPSLLGDEARLRAMMLGMSKVAEQKVTEFDPYRIHPPGDPQAVENDTMLRLGFSIAKTSWDGIRKVYIINWVRIRPARPEDFQAQQPVQVPAPAPNPNPQGEAVPQQQQ